VAFETTAAAVHPDSLEALYASLGANNFDAGWNKETASLYPEPHKTFVPAHWRYRDGRAGLERAGHLIGTELAERRNLILFNPREGNRYGTSATLVAAYQMLLPGEDARSHRHTPNALRLIVEGDAGAYTVVDGERVPMMPGDVVLTPSWSWHGHGNAGKVPAYWIDYLDIPLVHAVEPMFFEPHPDDFEKNARPVATSPLRFTWPWVETELNRARSDARGRFGRQVTLDTPALRTMRLHMHAHASGIETAPYRTTANNIYSVVSGTGRTTIDGTTFAWERGDVFVAPAWRTHRHRIEADAVLFRVTDEPLLEMLGMLREEADSPPG
jgi:gentisate 1,2-dioxygenase